MAERIVDWNAHTSTTAPALRAARHARGLSRERVARAAQISVVRYNQLEDGAELQIMPSVDAVRRVCAVLGLAPAELLPLPWRTENTRGITPR